MRHQAVRTIALMLGVLLAAAAPAHAGSITFGELARAVGANGQLRPAGEVRLRFGAQGGQTQAGQTQSATASSDQQQSNGSQPAAPSGATSAPAASDPSLSQSGGQVETVDLGDVTGTVCDCGEIPPPPPPPGAAGFPWWTLAGIPLVCLSGICTGNEEEPPGPPPPGPTPTPPQVPEPMSLLLFGSGLLAVGAGARRRRARKLLEGDTLNAAAAEEV